ncbi:hypothetical protein [Brucella sp. IR073]|uniref:hypothetical protein n=1 Tax=unclassified Brucella TaxID=2632610 RepID=UPI003B97E4DA
MNAATWTQRAFREMLETEAFFARDMLRLIVDYVLEISPLPLDASQQMDLQVVNTLAIVARDRADGVCQQIEGFHSDASAQESAPVARAPGLLRAFAEYQAACQAFNSRPEFKSSKDEAAAVEATYGPPMRVLSEWDQPLESLEEVREAIRFAFTEQAICDDMVKQPLQAALTYLEKVTGWKDPVGGEA